MEILPADIVIQCGRADGGRTFVAVTHLPTGIQRVQVGLEGRPYSEIVQALKDAVKSEVSRQFAKPDDNH